jgi:hypothetical protein
LESQPRQVLEDGTLEFGPAALPVVILDPQQDPPTRLAGIAPHAQRVDDVAEVKKSGGSGGEAG